MACLKYGYTLMLSILLSHSAGLKLTFGSAISIAFLYFYMFRAANILRVIYDCFLIHRLKSVLLMLK